MKGTQTVALLTITILGCSGTGSGDKTPTDTNTTRRSAAASSSSGGAKPASVRHVAMDGKFGEAGSTTLTPPSSPSGSCYGGVSDIVAAKDGSTYILSHIAFGGDEPLEGCDSAVYKLGPNGKPDPSFGANGLARASKSYGAGVGLALAPDGGVFVLSRYIADGKGEPDLSVDLHFAAVGPVLATQAIAQSATSVVKLTAKGERDTSFGKQGEVRLSDKSGVVPMAVFADPDGSVMVMGAFQTPKISDTGQVFLDQGRAYLLRLTPKGTPDRTFGPKGLKFSDPKGVIVQGFLTMTPDGGYLLTGGVAREHLVKLNGKLEIDKTYGEQGVAVNPGTPDDYGWLVGLTSGAAVGVVVEQTGDKLRLSTVDPHGKGQKQVIFPWTGGALGNMVPTPMGGLLSIENLGEDTDTLVHIAADGTIDPKLNLVALASRKGALLMGRSTLDAAHRIVAGRIGKDTLVVTRSEPIW